MSPLIVGIDPGTTTGVALFDLQGSLLEVKSKRHFSKAAITRYIISNGSPLIIASDMNPLPKGIEKIASSFSSLVIIPEKVLRWKDKKRIVETFLKERELLEKPWRNSHEKDALIAAYLAWKRIRPRLLKLERKGLSHETLRTSLNGREHIS